MSDYFTVFGLPRKLGVDAEALQRRFYELSRQHHPDFHQGAGAERQAEVLGQSALVNRAYRALREPLARVEYLIALEEGREVREGATDKPKAPRELLEEMMEVQEALEEAKTAEGENLAGEAGAAAPRAAPPARGALRGRGGGDRRPVGRVGPAGGRERRSSAAARVVQAAARDAGLSAHRHRRPERRPGRA